jgi:subfamily B ATP-binding cassette protein HlyB/CyaB
MEGGSMIAEHFVQTNKCIEGRVPMIFITHQIPRGLLVDEVVDMGKYSRRMHSTKKKL